MDTRQPSFVESFLQYVPVHLEWSASCRRSLGDSAIEKLEEEINSGIARLQVANPALAELMKTTIRKVMPTIDCVVEPRGKPMPMGEAGFHAKDVTLTIGNDFVRKQLARTLFHELLHVTGADSVSPSVHNGAQYLPKSGLKDVVYACSFLAMSPDDSEVNSFISCRTCALADPPDLSIGRHVSDPSQLPHLGPNADDDSRSYCQKRGYPFSH